MHAGGPGASPASNAFKLLTHPITQRVRAQQTGLSSVGHHWSPASAVMHPEIRPQLADEAVHYALGSYSGKTDPNHLNGTYGGLSHPKYNELVKDEFKEFIKEKKLRPGQKISAADMAEFVDLIKNGKGANGQPHPRIAAFNGAVQNTVRPGVSAPSKIEDVIQAGKEYMKHPRFRLLAMGAVLAGILSETVTAASNVLEVAATTGHYRRAVDALQQGDIRKAHALLTGDRDSLYMEIMDRVGGHAALNFKTAVDKAFEREQHRPYE